MKRPYALSLLLGAALAGGLASASFAQPASMPMAGQPMAGHAMQGRMAPADPEAMAARHAEHLRAVLQLTPAQEPGLKAFIASMKPPGDMRERMAAHRQEMAGLTTPQRLDRMKARMAEHQAEFDRHADAVRRFYAQLTPSQQKAFDAMPMHGRGGHGMGAKGGGHHMMGGQAGMVGMMDDRQ